MGKSMEEKYSDVSHRILKKSVKKDKPVKKPSRETVPIKRKLPSIEDDDQPSVKLARTENVEPQIKPKAVDLSQFLVQDKNEINCCEVYVSQNCGSVQLNIKESKSKDLFLQDELSNSYENYINNDFSFQILDEISLEGLDGITIEAFWKRLSFSLNGTINLRDDLKHSIWRFICKKKNLKFFKLPEPRGVLDIFDRSKYFDTEIGVIMELAYTLPDIYSNEPVTHSDIQGSCSTFNNRMDISADVINLDVKVAERQYGTSLVIVADQKSRNKAIMWESTDPTTELMNMEYCILEKIGRSRRHGELTQGNMSLGSHFKMDPRSVFHYKKQLVRYGFLSKQFFYIKSAVIDQNKTGKLLHLKRFYYKVKPKQLLIAEQIVNAIKASPDCRIEFSELKSTFKEFTQPVLKIVKSPEFRKYIKTRFVCYRDMYPNAKKAEYMRKAKPVEKIIKCIELINPSINIGACWPIEQDDSDDDNAEEEETTGAKIYNMECFKEVYYHILSKGKEGSTSQDIQKLVGVDSNTIRMCLNKLVIRNVVTVKKLDQGKQRHLSYYANYLDLDDVRLELNPEPPKPPNNVLAKFKERQRAAIEKSNQTPVGNEEVPSKNLRFEWKFETIVPKLTCHFFVRSRQNLICKIENAWIDKKFTPIENNFMIQLNTSFPKTVWVFDLNEILNKTGPDVIMKAFKANFNPDMVFTSKNDVNHMTKLILLKAALGDFEINANTLNCLSRKRQIASVPILSDMGKAKVKTGIDKLQYMGDNPVPVFSEKDKDICIDIIVSTPPYEFKDSAVYPHLKELSERVLSRIRIILRIVYEKRIFEEMYKLVKVIEEEEAKEGYTKKIDRKSLARILKRLVEEGYLKIFKITMYDDKVTKNHTFICVPTVDHTDSLIQSACQQLKWKYFIGSQKKAIKANVPALQKTLEEKIQKTASPFSQSDVMSSVMELKQLTRQKQNEVCYKFCRLTGQTYGFKPKFIRMRIVHEFLHYLIYGYDRSTKALSEEEVAKLFESYHINVTKDDLKQIPKIYSNEINWKMFIPPLPHHGGWMVGWVLMCDVILRLPISVFCKIHNVGLDVPELMEILNHPIKRFYLVKDLPESVRAGVLFKRKYLFNIHDTICRLAWCGLVQFGPRKYKEKDQVFVYLNQMASLLDTTSSEPAYNKVTDKEYRKLAFHFINQADIDSYWYNAYGICLSTKLNAKESGQIVTIYDPQSRPLLIKALKSKTPEEALRDDNGEIPGDRRGAGGFDSTLWSHIVKNWFWAKQTKLADKTIPGVGLRKERLEKIPSKAIPFNELHTVGQANKVYLHKTAKEGRETKTKLRKFVHEPLKPSKSTHLTRRIPHRGKRAKRQYHDSLDKKILKRIGDNVRIRWNVTEDRLLLLSLAASTFLNPRSVKKQLIPYSVMRDVLHRVSPQSRDKTSSAIQRRIKNSLSRKHQYVENNAQNLLELRPVANYYTSLLNNLIKEKSTELTLRYKESQLIVAYIVLMSYLIKHQKDAENVLQGNLISTDYLSEDRVETTQNSMVPVEEGLLKFKDVISEDDIKRDVLKSVIHSSLACKNNPGWTFQLFKIYQKYSDNLICDALGELKRSQAISFNKFVTKKAKNRWHTPFQLSNLYVISQLATFNVTTATEAYNTLLNVKESRKFLDFSQETIESKKYGQLLALNEFCCFWEKVQFKFHLPRMMVILNPHVKDHSELIEDLAVRWQMKLKKMQQDTENDQDNESENRSIPRETDTASSSKENAPALEADKGGSQTLASNFNDLQNNPLDLTVEPSNTETIDRLKTWVTDCMEAEKERRSPSPDFMRFDAEEEMEVDVPISAVHADQEECYDEVDKICMYNVKKMLVKDPIPTLDEIKEGMTKYSPPSEERRLTPYITDLWSVLMREYNDQHTDEKKIERYKKHFITQYPELEDITLDVVDELQDFYMMEYLQSTAKNKRVWKSVKSKLVIDKPRDITEVYRILEENHGGQGDFHLADQIVNFVFEKRCLGATGPQLKEEFRHLERTCPLEIIVKALEDMGILLRVGVCSISFVHHIHQSPWLIETFALSCDEQRFLEEKATADSDVKKKIDKQLEEKTFINILVKPWIKVDGTLNEESFKTWLCNILSHCLNYPKITFMKLCEKFCYIKPVDIYCILEALQELGCVELFMYEENEQDLFSNWEYVNERKATFLDNLENMYILPNNVSMTCLGSFIHDVA